MTFTIFLLLGILSGFLVGILPGISASFVMIVAAPFLFGQDILTILAFYLGVLSASQYSESIVSLSIGLPGESTSLPAVALRNNFLEPVALRQAMYNCATGSLIGSVLAVIVTLPALYLIKDSVFYLKTIFIVGLGFFALIMSAISSTNRWYESFVLIGAGWFLGSIGYDSVGVPRNFMTFNNPYLMGGIPFMSVTVGLFVVPALLKSYIELNPTTTALKLSNTKIKWYDRNELLIPSIRGSIIGYMTGLIPYAGAAICSNVAYFIEKKLGNSPLAQLTSAETANNAAWFSVIVPMLLFGIAIVPSEAVLLEIMSVNGQVFNWQLLNSIMLKLGLIMLFINIVCWILSFYTVNSVIKVFNIPPLIIILLISLIMLMSVYHVGQEITQGWYYIICTAIFTPIGLLLYKKDTMPLVFAFLLQTTLEPAIFRLHQIYF